MVERDICEVPDLHRAETDTPWASIASDGTLAVTLWLTLVVLARRAVEPQTVRPVVPLVSERPAV